MFLVFLLRDALPNFPICVVLLALLELIVFPLFLVFLEIRVFLLLPVLIVFLSCC